MDRQQSSEERNEKDNDRDLSNTEFSFKYTESGGIAKHYLLISYNSKKNTVVSSTDISGSNITQKQPSQPDEHQLKEIAKKF